MLRALFTAVVAVGLGSITTDFSSARGEGSGATREVPPVFFVKGTLAYPQRIGLAQDGIAVVELRDVTSSNHTIVQEQRIELSGRQVPIAFELAVHRGALMATRQYSVRGAVLLHGKPVWSTEPVLIEPAARVMELGSLPMVPVKAEGFAGTLRCGNQSVSIGYEGGVMHLMLSKVTLEMRPVEAASGVKFAAVADSTTTLWSKGDHAMLVIRGQTYPECTRPARQPFRAAGNAPVWRLELTDSKMTLLTDNGETRIEATPKTIGGAAVFRHYVARTGGHDVTVTILQRPCSDTITGQLHPHEVVVVLDGRRLHGCGGDSVTLAQGGE
jgi:uncharacterized membrane protein/uncharacterized lipoprotein YbaY